MYMYLAFKGAHYESQKTRLENLLNDLHIHSIRWKHTFFFLLSIRPGGCLCLDFSILSEQDDFSSMSLHE
jgi:hypothetical protein